MTGCLASHHEENVFLVYEDNRMVRESKVAGKSEKMKSSAPLALTTRSQAAVSQSKQTKDCDNGQDNQY